MTLQFTMPIKSGTWYSFGAAFAATTDIWTSVATCVGTVQFIRT